MKRIEVQKTKAQREAAIEGFNNLFKKPRQRKPIPVYQAKPKNSEDVTTTSKTNS